MLRNLLAFLHVFQYFSVANITFEILKLSSFLTVATADL